MTKRIYLLTLALIFIISAALLFFRLKEVPAGVTVDETSIAYNAALIAKDLRDENGRLLPFFFLTVDQSDWKQPVSIYLTAIFFKLFGSSFVVLKVVNVVVALSSLILAAFLGNLSFGSLGSIVASVIFITSPIVIIHSHLAQENIVPIFFITAWLISLLIFSKKRQILPLIISGIFLGISLYSYKGMRAITPVYAVLTLLYLLYEVRSLRPLLYFAIGFLPFIVILPWLNSRYPGALFDSQDFKPMNLYDLLYPFLSSFDLSALFIKGDVTPWHSTGRHGVFLIATIPVFLTGLWQAVLESKKNKFWLLILLGFFLSPVLFGLVNSVYRFSRLLVLVPFFMTITTLGFLSLLKSKYKKPFIIIIALLFSANFIDFARYYWFEYPKATENAFLRNNYLPYEELRDLSKKFSLAPFVYKDEHLSQGENAHFFESAYFPQKLRLWTPNQTLPLGSILMTKQEHLPKLKTVGTPINEYYFFVNPGEAIIGL